MVRLTPPKNRCSPDRLPCGAFRRFCWQLFVACFALWNIGAIPQAAGLESVTIRQDGAVFTVRGKILAEAQDGGMILRDRQGKLWPLQPHQIKARTEDDIPYKPLNQEELRAALLEELPPGFSIHKTKHYLICYNTSKKYAEWCGSLLERLFRAYNNFWMRRDLTLSSPEMPLIALVFKDKQSYRRYAVGELGDAVDTIDGYYNMITNRIAMYDLTAAHRNDRQQTPIRNLSEINQLFAQPGAGQVVATVIHEATHQIAFNCGVQQRLSDIPVWLNEGMAMYFETPDLRSKKGWRGMGEINLNRFARFRKYLQKRPDDSILSLIANADRMQGRSKDAQYQSPMSLLDAYSEAWAITYYLITYHEEAFIDYLKFLSQKKPGQAESDAKKIEDFENFFGKIELLDKKFVQRMQKEIKRNARNLSKQP